MVDLSLERWFGLKLKEGRLGKESKHYSAFEL